MTMGVPNSNRTTIDCDLHLHTNHSIDCETQVADLLSWAETKRLDLIALTDHDQVTAFQEAQTIESTVRVIPGVEVTTRTGTHLLGYFITEPIVSRDILAVIDEIHERGGICSLPHPYRSDTGLIYNHEINNLHSAEEVAQVIEAVDLIEGLNAKCSTADHVKTDAFIARHSQKRQSAGSDGHQPYEAGRARLRLTVDTTDITALSDAAIKQALLHNPREIVRETAQQPVGADALALSMIEGARKTLKRSKALIPTTVWRRMRSVYLRSTGAVNAGAEMKSLQKSAPEKSESSEKAQ